MDHPQPCLGKTNLAVIYVYLRTRKEVHDNKRSRLHDSTPSMILFFFKYMEFFYIYMCTKNVWNVKHQKKVNGAYLRDRLRMILVFLLIFIF